MRPTRDQWALGVAVVTAQRSTCLRRKVGCVLLSARGHVLATGYNGVAAGQPHCNERTEQLFKLTNGRGLENVDTYNHYPYACAGASAPSGTSLDSCEAIHAEANALLQAYDVHEIETCYVTASPCVQCTKLLLNTSCQRIVFLEEYPHVAARELWERAGRTWQRFDDERFRREWLKRLEEL